MCFGGLQQHLVDILSTPFIHVLNSGLNWGVDVRLYISLWRQSVLEVTQLAGMWLRLRFVPKLTGPVFHCANLAKVNLTLSTRVQGDAVFAGLEVKGIEGLKVKLPEDAM